METNFQILSFFMDYIKTKERIKRAIERKLMTAPEMYGERLKGTLKDLWKLRVGDYRVIFLKK